jgi:integrase/recombinase XerD
MKKDRFGQATPINFEMYRKIREGFLEEHHKLFFDIAYYTGERWGAIAQLRINDVYSSIGTPLETITYRKNTRKDKVTRQVPIAKMLSTRLAAYTPAGGVWLFPSPDNDRKPITTRAMDFALRRAIKRSGYTGLGISTHSTRRGFITQLHQNGISVKVIQELTGHKSLAVLSRYIAVSEEQKLAAVSGL